MMCSRKLYLKESIPVVKKMTVIEEMIEEDSVTECNNRNIENFNQEPVIEEMSDECNNRNIENLRQDEAVLPSNIFSEQRKKVCRRKSVQVVEIKEVIEKNNDIAETIESNKKNVRKVTKMNSLVQESIFTKGSHTLNRKESIQMFRRMSITQHVADEKSAIDSCCENITQRKVVNKLLLKADVCSDKSKKLYKTQRNQVLHRMPVIEEIPNEECEIDSCYENITREDSRLIKTNACTLKSKKFCKKEKHQRIKRMPIIPEVDDEECENSYRIDESEDVEKKFDALPNSIRQNGNDTPPQDIAFLNENINTKETTNANTNNLPQVIISEKTNTVNDLEISSNNVKDKKIKDNISNREELKSPKESDEKNVYEGMTLNHLNEHQEENKSTKTDVSIERENETREVCSQVKVTFNQFHLFTLFVFLNL